jgi:hypothetical protein
MLETALRVGCLLLHSELRTLMKPPMPAGSSIRFYSADRLAAPGGSAAPAPGHTSLASSRHGGHEPHVELVPPLPGGDRQAVLAVSTWHLFLWLVREHAAAALGITS